MNPTLASRFAEFAHRLTPADIPAATRRRAAMHLLDTLAAGVAGSESDEAVRSRAALLEPAGRGSAVVWGTFSRTAASTAALLNGIAAHAYELDDSGGCDHSGAVVVPAVLAAAAVAPVDGSRLLLATVVGYELGRRVQSALGGYDSVNDRGRHSTGTCGPFAAAAAAAVTLGLDAARTTHAIGLAATAAAGSWAFISQGAMSKRLHVGRAAQAGLEAALLAAAGYTGPGDLFEAPWGGFLDLYRGSHPAQPGALTDGLGVNWQIDLASIKPHATCRSTHAAIDALLDTRSGLADGEEIVGIEVHTSRLIAEMCGGTAIDPLTAAQLSMPFGLAVGSVYGRVELDDILAGRHDERVRNLVGGVRIAVDPAQHGGSALPHLTVHTSTGAVRRAAAARPRGAWDHPLDASAVAAKARRLLERRLPAATAERLIAAVLSPVPADPGAIANLLVASHRHCT